VRRLPPYHVVDVRIRDPVVEEGRPPGGDADAEMLPEYYPYMAAAYTIAREKEEGRKDESPEKDQQQLQQQQTRAEDGGGRLRRMMSFVRGD